MSFHQLWNDETNNLIVEYDAEADALEEVRWRYEVWGEREANDLSLLRVEIGKPLVAVASGDELLHRARNAGSTRAVAD